MVSPLTVPASELRSVGLSSPNSTSPSNHKAIADISDGSPGRAPSPSGGSETRKLPTKHASMLSLGSSSSMSIHSVHAPSLAPVRPPSLATSQPDVEGSLTPTRKKSISKGLGSMIKGLFKGSNTKASTDGVDGAGKSSPNLGSPSHAAAAAAGKAGSFSLKAVFGSFTTAEPQPSKPAVQNSAKSSTAAIESEVQAAMRRAASITGRQHAPSTLLAVAKDLPPKMARPIWNLRDYAVVEKMYTGYASNVYKAFCKFSGETVCLKSYTLGNLCDLNRFQIFREVKLHNSLSHEHIIKLYGAFQQADQVVLVQEFADAGDLFTLLHRYGGRLPERTAVELVLHPFLLVINYLHANGIAHRDIKPENILFTADMRLKLCDFGLAINMREERAVTRAGTLEYMAPEVLNCPFKNKPEENKDNERLHYSYHVDTWAVGVLTYELLVGLPPFNDKQRNAVEDKIRLEMPRFPTKMSELARDFITRALEKDPIERPSIMDMLNHKWIKIHRRSSSVRQLRVERDDGAGTSGLSSPTGAVTPTTPTAAKPKKQLASQFEDIAEEDSGDLAKTSTNAHKLALAKELQRAQGGSQTYAVQGPPSSLSTTSTTSTLKVASSAKSFTAGALPKGAFQGLMTSQEVTEAKTIAAASRNASRATTRELDIV